MADDIFVDDPYYLYGEVQDEEVGEDEALSSVWLSQLRDYVDALFDELESSTTRENVLKMASDSRKSYHMAVEATNFPWDDASNVITPLTAMMVDELEPRLVASVIGRQPYIKAQRTGISTPEEAELVSKYDNFVLEHKVKVKTVVPQIIHELLLDGTVFVIPHWRRITRDVRSAVFNEMGQPAMQGGALQYNTEERVFFDGPVIDIVPLEFVYMPDDIGDDDEDWERAPVMRYLTYELAQLMRKGNDDGWMVPPDIEADVSDTVRQTQQQEQDKAKTHYSVMPIHKKPVECIEAYVWWEDPTTGEDVAWIVLFTLNSRRILRVRKQIDVFGCNIKQIRRLRLFYKAGMSWGRPAYSIIFGPQVIMDSLWNRCVNSADITITPFGFYQRSLIGAGKSEIEIKPGKMTPVDDVSSILFPNLSGFDPARFVPLLNINQMFFERLSNVTDFTAGRESEISGKRGTTATGTLAVLQEGKIKHEYRGSLVHEQFLSLFIMIHDLCVHNMPFEEQIAVVGSVTRYTMAKTFTFILTGSDLVANKFIERKEHEDFVMTVGQFRELLNPHRLLLDTLHSYQKFPAEEYIDPELNQLVMQFLEMRQRAQSIEALGIPREIARSLAQQGHSQETVKMLASEHGREMGELASFGEALQNAFAANDEGTAAGAGI